MIEVYQFGSSLTEENPNDVDIILVSDLPIDLCVYSKAEWANFKKVGISSKGKRIKFYPNKMKHLFKRIENGEYNPNIIKRLT